MRKSNGCSWQIKRFSAHWQAVFLLLCPLAAFIFGKLPGQAAKPGVHGADVVENRQICGLMHHHVALRHLAG
jgi:hypothetical protein